MKKNLKTTTLKSTTKSKKETPMNFNDTSLGILLESLRNNGVIVDAEKFQKLYETEIQIAYNNGQLAALPKVAE